MTEEIPVRFLHLPNEPSLEFVQFGPRGAFEKLYREGRISHLETFSFCKESVRLGGDAAACSALLGEVERFQPDILFWQHAGDFQVSREFVRRLRAVSPKTLLVYHEGDVYGRIHKRIPGPVRTLLSTFDLVFQVGIGPMQTLSELAGAKKVLWSPHSFEEHSFPWQEPLEANIRMYDVVMIGNLVQSIKGVWRLPGTSQRLRLARSLTKTLGNGFALFGQGWKLPSAKGALPYDQQHHAIRQARVSVGWDHFPGYSYYFSNRLPIALAAGVPRVTGYNPGYENVFRDCPGLVCAKNVREAVEATLYLLSLDRKTLVDLGVACRDFAFAHFEAKRVYASVFEKCLDHLAKMRATAC